MMDQFFGKTLSSFDMVLNVRFDSGNIELPLFESYCGNLSFKKNNLGILFICDFLIDMKEEVEFGRIYC